MLSGRDGQGEHAGSGRQVEIVDDACDRCGRDPSTLRRSVFAFRYDAWSSTDAFAEYVGRYRELGFTDFIVSWPTGRGAASVNREAVLERVAADPSTEPTGALIAAELNCRHRLTLGWMKPCEALAELLR